MSEECAAPPLNEPPAARPGLPPLRVHHILAATGVTAVLLSVNEGLRQNQVAGLSLYLRSGPGVMQTISTGVAVTSVMFGIFWRQQGRGFFCQPGHWLLVHSALFAGTFALAAALAAMHMPSDVALQVMLGLWLTALSLLSAAICLGVAIRVADTWLWRTTFLLAGSMSLLTAVLPWLVRYTFVAWFFRNTFVAAFSTAGVLATTLVLLAAAVSDRWARRKRDWAHWLGVALALGTRVTWVVQSVWNWVMA